MTVNLQVHQPRLSEDRPGRLNLKPGVAQGKGRRGSGGRWRGQGPVLVLPEKKPSDLLGLISVNSQGSDF